ncbi:MAG: efflux RND transporter periplasmic adaptor subunit [Rhodospirillaceae bacterium]|jgi:membrane fusion protein, multidrug efflux system|nr:efflux RND transporter periplasmic adaptor subunit [Rhodospirillaceae bacterium]MBT4590141.1 efflux RND transporter periplasmic adaptor subunit [Rhodospirillaceae bacterium]MBT4939023.1 efflux RND transporter periplasmic adaptor subunit [Rhodospirillaceae bacterium]MBT5939051.1 efflux RND transporter periplasmic adaptor subunit [Rhodospirillaceae bacterium]MBT7269141.1 efflux RND transporter periplasmic adaptor subunit [Rhodospirillaceae bacterium]
MNKSYLIAAGVALIAVGWIASGQFGGDEEKIETAANKTQLAGKAVPLTKVRVMTSTAQIKVNELVILGKTEASRRVDLKAETSGRIVALKAKKGDRLKKGDVIAQIALDDRPARMSEAKAKLRQREIEFQAAKELSARNFRSKVKLAETEALLDSARASLATIKLDMNRTVIRAAFDGVLESRPVEIGDVISVGYTVATIVDLSPMLVVANIPESQIGLVKSGLTGKARLVTGRKFEGTIRYVSAEAVNTTRTFKIEMETPNQDRSIVAGLTAELRLSLGEVKAHRISPAVLTLSHDGLIGLKSVDADNIVRFHSVQLVADTPNGMWLGGLPNHLSLITVGQEYVKVGQQVNPQPGSATAISELKEK